MTPRIAHPRKPAREIPSFGSGPGSPVNGDGMGWSDPSEVLSPAEGLLEVPAPELTPEAEPEEPES
ncbi:hypothetical protein TMEN_9133 [Trichophyton mentagrophytes]|nr:hypothetical protein TMEN_9133 [Trichophyton mentagrophytes]